MREINSLTNETIAEYKKLKDKKYRLQKGLYMVEGLRMVSDAAAYNQSIKALFVDKTKIDKFESIISKTGSGCEVFILTEQVLNSLSDTVNSQGIIAAIQIKKTNIFAPKSNCLILDGISDPGNLGTIIRTAAAFGFKDIYFINCADIYSPKVVRSTMSGIFQVNLFETEAREIISILKTAGYKIYCADLDGYNIKDFKKQDNFALVIGSEAFGIRREFIEICDSKITIPMNKGTESLNAAVAAAIIMFELKK